MSQHVVFTSDLSHLTKRICVVPGLYSARYRSVSRRAKNNEKMFCIAFWMDIVSCIDHYPLQIIRVCKFTQNIV